MIMTGLMTATRELYEAAKEADAAYNSGVGDLDEAMLGLNIALENLGFQLRLENSKH
jgi:hypothetical protein